MRREKNSLILDLDFRGCSGADDDDRPGTDVPGTEAGGFLNPKRPFNFNVIVCDNGVKKRHGGNKGYAYGFGFNFCFTGIDGIAYVCDPSTDEPSEGAIEFLSHHPNFAGLYSFLPRHA